MSLFVGGFLWGNLFGKRFPHTPSKTLYRMEESVQTYSRTRRVHILSPRSGISSDTAGGAISNVRRTYIELHEVQHIDDRVAVYILLASIAFFKAALRACFGIAEALAEQSALASLQASLQTCFA